jgi:dienelactone hydrolase
VAGPVHRRRRRRRRLARTAVVAVVLAAGAVVAGLALTGGGGKAQAHRTATTTSSAPTTTTSTAPPLGTDGTYAVATTELTVSDGGRLLPTTVWYPALQGGSGPDRAKAPYPLLVFSQGYDEPVTAYRALLVDWASAGFVVAGPTYPRTDPSDPAGVDENDIVHHPADLRAVITTLLDDGAGSGTVLAGLVDPTRVGVTGQSDGGDVSLAVAAGSCCADSRVKAAAILSGAELAAFGGGYFGGRPVPMLVVQGTADDINPPGCSAQLYDAAPAPKFGLELLGAGHLPPYVDAGTDQQTIATVTTDFFDAELAGQQAGLAAMAAAGAVAGVTQFTTAPTGPWPAGVCPGAPG